MREFAASKINRGDGPGSSGLRKFIGGLRETEATRITNCADEKPANGDTVEAEAWLKVAECRAARLVEEHWKAIGRGAFALVEHGSRPASRSKKSLLRHEFSGHASLLVGAKGRWQGCRVHGKMTSDENTVSDTKHWQSLSFLNT